MAPCRLMAPWGPCRREAFRLAGRMESAALCGDLSYSVLPTPGPQVAEPEREPGMTQSRSEKLHSDATIGQHRPELNQTEKRFTGFARDKENRTCDTDDT